MKDTIPYRRVSTQDQKDNGTSLERQLELSVACSKYFGLGLVDDFEKFEEDYSGATLERPVLSEIRERLRSGKAKNIIVQCADRLDRSEWGVNLLILLQEFKALGVNLYYSDPPRKLNLNNPMEILLESISGWNSGNERITIVNRLKNGMRYRISQGSVMVRGQPPYGYQVVKEGKRRKLVVYEEEAKIVRLIFHWYVYGDENNKRLTMGQIASRLNEMGIEPQHDKRPNSKAPKSKCWKPVMISRILGRETYIGFWHWKPGTDEHLVVEDPDMVIIDKQTWKMAEELKDKNKKGNTRQHKYNALLRLRTTCGECGYKMGVNSFRKKEGHKVHIYYKCSCAKRTNSHYVHTCSNGAGFPVAETDKELWERVKALLSDQKKLNQFLTAKKEKCDQEISPLRIELDTVNSLIREKTDELKNVIYTHSRLAKNGSSRTIAILEKQTNELEQVIERLEQRRDEFLSKIEQQELDAKRIDDLRTLALKIGKGMIQAEGNFEAQKAIFDFLDVQVTLIVVNGEKKISATCELGSLDDYEPCNANQSWRCRQSLRGFTLTG